MVRRNKVLIAFLMTVLMASVMFVAINTANAANPNIIRDPSNEMQLVVDFYDNELQLETTAVEGYYYQYWVRTKVLTDATTVVVDDPDANLATEQFIWQMRREFSNQPNAQISVDSNDVDENGRYSVIVRVKDGLEGPIVDEIYGSYTPAGISEVKIDGKTVNGEVIIKKGSTVPVSIISHTPSVTAYKIFGKDESLLYDSDQASGNLDISSLAMGNNVLRAEITAGGSKDSLYFNVYVYDEYVAAQMPEIISLDGTSNSQGATTFTMSVQYADGTPIPIGNAGMFDFKLTSDGKSPDAQIVPETINDVASFKVQFTVNYAGYGIYQTVGTVSRKDVNGADDKIVIYYDRYIRSGVTLNQTAVDENNNDLASVNYTVAKGAKITINATGDIPDVTNETYAFYREDASGWVLIRDYSTKTDFIWTPQKAGVYNIQARIKEGGKDAPGSYQKAVTRTYTIVDDALTGTLDVYAYDFGTKDKVTSLQAGRPCKIFAEYTGEWDTEEILYMFTLTSTNLGTVYLNKYSLSPYIMFVPGKVDNYKITARAISLNSYGYKDISGDLVISSGIDKLFVSFDLNYEDAPELNDMELARGAAYGELPEVSRTGYKFIGWYTAKTGGTKVTSTTTAENSYHTLYARWAIIYDNVAFNANKGSGSTEPDMMDFEGETITLTYGEALPAIADKAAPTRYGYEFNGFWTSASAGTQLYKPDLTANVEALEVMLTENVLYASWTAKNVTITYANTENSDFVAPSSYSVAFDSNYATAANYNTRFPSISKDYYTFIGWYTKNGASTGDWGEKITAGSTKLTDENGVVYARWQDNSFSVRYHVGSETVHTETVKRGEKPTYTTKPVITGKVFVGWYTSPELAAIADPLMAFDLNTPISGELDLYAGFAEVTVTLKAPLLVEYAQNSEFTIPQATVWFKGESVDGVISSVKAPDGSIVTVTDGKFTLAQVGTYTLVYSGTVGGEVRTAEKTITVATNPVFATASSANSTFNTNDSIPYGWGNGRLGISLAAGDTITMNRIVDWSDLSYNNKLIWQLSFSKMAKADYFGKNFYVTFTNAENANECLKIKYSVQLNGDVFYNAYYIVDGETLQSSPTWGAVIDIGSDVCNNASTYGLAIQNLYIGTEGVRYEIYGINCAMDIENFFTKAVVSFSSDTGIYVAFASLDGWPWQN